MISRAVLVGAFLPLVGHAGQALWPICHAVEKKLGECALLIPEGDWFAQSPTGEVREFEKPTAYHDQNGSMWRVRYTCSRYRIYNRGQLGTWINGPFLLADLDVDTPPNGGATVTRIAYDLTGWKPILETYARQIMTKGLQ